MKAERNYPKYTITPKAEAAILRGHPWVYDAEITHTEGQAENGGLVDVVSKKGRYLGTGFLSEHSKIRVRLISRNANDRFDAAFWRRKLQWAWEYRKSVMAPEDLDACRIIFGEADAFPGLTVDKFHDLLSVQVLSVGMERIQDLLLPALAVHSVTKGTRTLKDAVNEALREWTSRIDDTHYVLGSVMGPHPFPTIVRDFQSIISREAREQILDVEKRLPDVVMACVGGGSNAMGMFYNFIPDKQVRLIGCEAAGKGLDTEEHAATISKGTEGIFHGMKSYFCQDKYGQIAPVYSISAGLDYPGIGPEHAYLHDSGRAEYVAITDDEAVDAFEYLSRTEGIIPAIESAHAIAQVMKIAPKMKKDEIIIVCLSGRGDKDVAAMARYRGVKIND